jgi:hypothetical protein
MAQTAMTFTLFLRRRRHPEDAGAFCQSVDVGCQPLPLVRPRWVQAPRALPRVTTV